jgi:RHS repeat-associated protein
MTPEETHGHDNRTEVEPAPAAAHRAASKRRRRRARASATPRNARPRAARNFLVWVFIFVLFAQPNFALAGTLQGPVASRSRVASAPVAAGILVSTQLAFAGALDYISSFFGSGDSGDKASPAVDPAALAAVLPTPTPDAAISRHAPALNGGRIEGNLRVNSGENVAINSTFQLTGDLFTVGTPNVIVNSGASHGGIVDDGGASTPSGYPVTLNSGFVMPGKIHKRANALALPSMPTVPAASGTRTVNINTASDVSSIGTWSTVKDLNVTPSNLIINVPPGNYGTFNMNGASRLNFTAGTYNFSGTINLNAGSTVQTTGAVTINIAQNFNLNGGFVTGTNTQPGDVLVNIIGGSCSFNSASSVMGSVRAPNANVSFNGTGTVTGQVIANYLNMNGGKIVGNNAVTPPPDTTQPTITITSPANNSTTTNASVTVSGTAADPGTNASGIASVTVNNVAATYTPATGQWTLANVALNLGANTITAKAVDVAGNQTTTSVTVTRQLPPDTAPPAVAITAPANNSTTTASSITVSGTVSDTGTNASGVNRVVVGGVTATITGGNWTASGVPVANIGANTVTATAFDNANNQASASIVVNRQQPPDTTAPAVSITSPANNFTTQADTITVSGAASDPGTPSSGISQVTVNGMPAIYNAANGTWTISGVALNVGPNTITARAYDNANNQTTATINVTREQPPDSAPPTLTVASPADGFTTQSAEVAFNGTATDTGTNASGVASVTVGGIPATYDPQTGAWSVNSVPLPVVGTNDIVTRATDHAGNVATHTTSITRQPPSDTQAPQIAIATPGNNTTTIEATITVTGSADDPGQYQSGVTSVVVNGVTAAYDAATHQWTASNVPVAMGPNTITATATDGAGNHTDASVSVTREEPPDTQAPDLAISEPAEGSTTYAETITVSGTVSDTGTNASGVSQVTVNGMPATVSGNNWTVSGVALSMDANTITVRAYDNQNNQTVKTVHVTRALPPDTKAPDLTVSQPADDSTTDSTSTDVSGTVTDTGVNASGVASLTVNGAAAQFNAQTGSFTFPNVALTLGPNTITVRATDQKGNEAVKVVHVTRVHPPDTQPPTLTITSPADGVTVPDETITVTGTATDEGVNPAGVSTVTVNGVAASYDATTHVWSAANVALNEGANIITVVATDSAPTANNAAANITVTRRTPDRDAPTVNISSPLAGFETYDAAIDVAGTAVDDGLNATGVVRVTVNGRTAEYDAATHLWSISAVTLAYGDNAINVVATDAATPAHDGAATVHVTRKRIPPPTLVVTNPQNGGVYPASTLTVAGTVSSLSTDPVVVKVNGETAAVTGGNFAKTVTLVEGSNTINVVAADSLGQEAQSSVTVLRDQTAPTVTFSSAPQTVQPGATYQVTVEASDNVGVASVEFSVNGVLVASDADAPYVFTLNVPAALAAGNTLTLSAVAHDLSGTSATATAQARTTGPGGISGYAFDDTTGYVLEGAQAAIAGETSATSDAAGTYGLISNNPTGVVRVSKDGYTSVERIYTVSPSEGTALFDARLTPLDANANQTGAAGGTANGDGGRISLNIAAGSLQDATDVRLTSVSPQGLANLLPYGWSPVPGAVVDVRAGAATSFQFPAHLKISNTPVSVAGLALTFARYDEQSHGWRVVATNLAANAGGSLEGDISTPGQYAFLVADQGATAPPPAQGGQALTSSSPADSTALEAATASAVSTPRVATYSAQARATVSFVASAPTQLPSGVAIEASFGETYNLLGGKDSVYVDRPQQDFILYSFPAVSPDQPNRLGATFIAKPTRTDFNITDLLGANVHVDIRSGRQAKTGVLVGPTGGTVRAGDGATMQIAPDSFSSPQPVFFESGAPDTSGLTLPEGYEVIGLFDVNLSGASLSHGATISMPAPDGDNSRVVAARVLSVGGRVPKVVARVTETDGRLSTTTYAPAVPSGVQLPGIRAGGRYVFIRVPVAFGYVSGAVTDAASGGVVASAKVYGTRAPFVDVTGADGRYVLVGAAGDADAGVNQLAAESLQTDATGHTSASLAAQDATVLANIAVAPVPLRVESVSPANNAASMIATTPVTVTFNKPVTPSTLTASAFRVTTESNNPVLGAITLLAGNRVAVLTPQATLAASTRYVVSVAQTVRDTYGRPLEAAFTSSFTTAAPVAVGGRLRPDQIRINYPDESGVSVITIPARSVPEGSVIIAVNTTTGATVTTVAGESAITLQIPASVGDEVSVTIRQPDGTDYVVSQAAYRRADGFTSVGANGGSVVADAGGTVLSVPPGAIKGVADIKMSPKTEDTIPIPRANGLEEPNSHFGGAVEIKSEGNFTCEKELHIEIPAPAGTQEGQLIAFLKPTKVKDESGQMVDVWDSVTSGRVVNGMMKSNSPPFPGLFLASFAIIEIWAMMPTRARIVMGYVRQFEPNPNLPELPVFGATVLAGSYTTGWFGRMVGRTQYPYGRFAMFEFGAALNSENEVPLKVYDDLHNRQAQGIALTSGTFEEDFFEGVSGFATFRGIVLMPRLQNDPINDPPPGMTVFARGNNGPQELDTLFTRGISTVGSGAVIVARSDKKLAQINGTVLVAGVTTRQLTWTEQPDTSGGLVHFYTAPVEVTAEGSYAVTVKGSTRAGDPAATTTVNYNFVGLRNPNTRPPLPGPPSVIHVTPGDGADNVELTTDVRVDFSEPVHNLVGGTTVYLQEVGHPEKIGGQIISGGTTVQPDTPNISSIVFKPAGALGGGKKYTLRVTSEVLDDTNIGLDQEYTGDGDNSKKEFESTFETFSGLVLTEKPLPETSTRIKVVGNYAYTIKPVTANNLLSRLTVYDISDPQKPVVRGTVNIPQRAFDLSITESEEDAFKVEGRVHTRIAAVVTSSPQFPDQHANVWFVNLDDVGTPEIVGVTSLYLPVAVPSNPLSVEIHKGRAYVGSAPYRGVCVVDIAKSVELWIKGIRAGKTPLVDAVRPPSSANTGFGQDAKIQTVSTEQALGLGAFLSAPSISVIDQLAGSEKIPVGQMPVVYIANNAYMRLMEVVFPRSRDGRHGFNVFGGELDDRIFPFKVVDPKTAAPSIVKTVQDVFVGTGRVDLALLLGYNRLWIYDVTQAGRPVQYTSKSFAEMGIQGSARYMDIEGTLAYIVVDNDIVVVDFSDPENPHLSTRLTGVGSNLRALAVKDGFIYSLSPGSAETDGLHISIAVPTSRLFVAGASADPATTCAGPVVVDRTTKMMRQNASIYFQVFGHKLPAAQSVVIRKGEAEVARVPATIMPSSTDRVLLGHAEWSSSQPIDRTAEYTAELLIDQDTASEFHSLREPIPFTFLIENAAEQMSLTITGKTAQADEKASFGYVLGSPANVTLTVNGSVVLTAARGFGINIEQPTFAGLGEGRYPFTFRAEMTGNASVSDQISGTLVVRRDGEDARPPGHTLVSGVDIASGNLGVSQPDVPQINNRGISLGLVRSYNSAGANTPTPLGYGWQHNYNVLITFRRAETGGGTYQLRGGDGSGQRFKAATPTGYLMMKAEKPYHGTLFRNADGSLDYYTSAHVRYHFPGALELNSFNFYDQSYMGNLEYIQEPNANRLTLAYDPQGRMISVTDSSERALEFVYEAAPNPFAGVVAATNATRSSLSCVPRGQFSLLRTRFVKAQLGQAWRIKQVNGPAGLVVEYKYDADGNLIKATRKGGDEISAATADAVWSYAYKPDAPSGATVQLAHLIKSATNPNSHTTNYEYYLDKLGAPAKSVARPEGVVNGFTYEFDQQNRIKQATAADARGNPTVYTLTEDGYTTAVDAPRGAHSEYAFNPEGQKTREVDPLGAVTTYEYDPLGNVKKTKHVGADGTTVVTETVYDQTFSKPVLQRDANGYATEYSLDGHGNVTRVKLPTGASQSFDYNIRGGDLTTATDERGLVTRFVYDRYGNPKTVTRQTAEGSSSVAEYTFDGRSRMTALTDSSRPSISRTYDALDRVVAEAISDPAGFRETLNKSYTYNGTGLVLTAEATGGGQSLNQSYAYDDVERVTRIDETASGVSSSLARTFTYDPNSNVLSKTDRRGVKTTYEYDALNFMTSERVSGPFGADVRVSSINPDLVGNAVTTTDQFNQQISYSYDGLHRLQKRTLPGGYIEEQTLDANGNVVSTKDRNGRVSSTTYDPLGRPKELRDPAGRTRTWTYDDAEGKVSQVLTPQNLTVTDQNDAYGRRIRHEVKFDDADYVTRYAYSGRMRVTVDAREHSFHEDLSAFGEVGNFVAQAGGQTVRTESRYGAFGGLKSFKDANGNSSSFSLDGLNRRVSANYPEDKSETWGYDGEGLTLSHRDIRGASSSMTYDNQRRALGMSVDAGSDGTVKVFENSYDDAGHRLTRKDANEHASVYSYDGLGRLVSLKNADNRTATYEYDGLNLRRESDFKGVFTEYQYDPVDRVVEVKDRTGQVTVVNYSDAGGVTRTATDRRGSRRVEAADPLGRVKSVIDGGQPLASYEYDGNNNRAAVVDGRTNRSVYQYDELNRVVSCQHAGIQTETFAYDAAGNLTSYNDGRGADVTMQYDGLNHLKSSKDGAENVTTYKYDGGGLLLEKTAPRGPVYKTSFEYNALGSLKKVTDAATGTWAFTYDAKQNLKTATDARHNEVGYDYDALDRPTAVHQPMSLTTTYGYDANSNRTSVIDAKGQHFTLDYDALDRLKSNEFRNDAENLTDRFDYTYDPEADLTGVRQTRADGAEVQVKQYALSYDARRRLQSATDEFGKTVSYEYDPANNLTRLTDAAQRETAYTYDGRNRLQNASMPGGRTAGFEWYADGRLKHVGYGGGLQRDYTYDDADRVSHITNTVAYDGAAGTRDDFAYTYDANSNVASETRTLNNVATRTSYYQYDNLDRLKQAQYVIPGGSPEGRTLNWTYDPAGNRATESGVAPDGTPVGRSYQYDALNRLTEATDSASAFRYEYDNNGNLLATKAGNGQLISRFEYDARDHLRKVLDGQSQELARYDYDYAGRRTQKVLPGGAEQRFAYDGLRVLNEFDKRGQLQNRYDYGGGLLRAEFAGEGERFYFADGVGSTSSLSQITQAGQTQVSSQTASYSYDAWGGVVSATGTSANQLGFTGQRLDPETGLMPLGSGARYYASNLGRFTQQDSWTGVASAGQTLNRYSYGYGNPLRYVDPTGHRGTQFDPPDYSIHPDEILNALINLGTGFAEAALELVALPFDVGVAIGGFLTGQNAADLPFLSKTFSDGRDAYLRGESLSDIASSSVKQLVFGTITFGIGPEIVTQLQLVQQLANGQISNDEYNERSMKSLGGFAFNVALLAVGGRAGRGKATVIEEGAETAAARRSPLRDVAGRVTESSEGKLTKSLAEREVKGLGSVEAASRAEGMLGKHDLVGMMKKAEAGWESQMQSLHESSGPYPGFLMDEAGAARVVKEYDVVPYRPATSPLENHHGLLDVWAKENIDGYVSRASDNPTMALSKLHHDATKAVYRDWLFERTGKRVGGSVDWKTVSPREMQSLTERMFDAAEVPAEARGEYYRALNKYIYR